MAYECLGLSLIQHKIHIKESLAEKLEALGLRLSLDQESVFDDEFWFNFTSYLTNNQIKKWWFLMGGGQNESFPQAVSGNPTSSARAKMKQATAKRMKMARQGVASRKIGSI